MIHGRWLVWRLVDVDGERRGGIARGWREWEGMGGDIWRRGGGVEGYVYIS